MGADGEGMWALKGQGFDSGDMDLRTPIGLRTESCALTPPCAGPLDRSEEGEKAELGTGHSRSQRCGGSREQGRGLGGGVLRAGGAATASAGLEGRHEREGLGET